MEAEWKQQLPGILQGICVLSFPSFSFQPSTNTNTTHLLIKQQCFSMMDMVGENIVLVPRGYVATSIMKTEVQIPAEAETTGKEAAIEKLECETCSPTCHTNSPRIFSSSV